MEIRTKVTPKPTAVLELAQRITMPAQEVVVKNPEKSIAPSATVPAPEAPVMTANQMFELFSKMSTENAQMLAHAIVEAQKPYVDPAIKANEELFRKKTRENMEAQRLAKKAEQDICPHMAGCNQLSESMSDRTSIIRHRLDSSETIGICTNCQRIWRENDPDYALWLRKPTNNPKSSASGDRQFRDPAKAREAGRS